MAGDTASIVIASWAQAAAAHARGDLHGSVWADLHEPTPDEVTITQEFSVDVQLWDHGIRSTRPCEPLMPRDSRPDENGAGG